MSQHVVQLGRIPDGDGWRGLVHEPGRSWMTIHNDAEPQPRPSSDGAHDGGRSARGGGRRYLRRAGSDAGKGPPLPRSGLSRAAGPTFAPAPARLLRTPRRWPSTCSPTGAGAARPPIAAEVALNAPTSPTSAGATSSPSSPPAHSKGLRTVTRTSAPAKSNTSASCHWPESPAPAAVSSATTASRCAPLPLASISFASTPEFHIFKCRCGPSSTA